MNRQPNGMVQQKMYTNMFSIDLVKSYLESYEQQHTGTVIQYMHELQRSRDSYKIYFPATIVATALGTGSVPTHHTTILPTGLSKVYKGNSSVTCVNFRHNISSL